MYCSLCHVYQPKSEIYFFGFSRGAHTVRTLAGFVSSQGILNPARYESDSELRKDIEILFKGFRFREFDESERSLETFYYNEIKYRKQLAANRGSFVDLVRGQISSIRKAEKLFKSNKIEFWKDHHPETKRSLSSELVHPHDVDKANRVGIRFLGLWDTVDSVGFPVEWVADFWNEFVYRFQFRNYRVNSFVSCALHAVSIDEIRKSFALKLIDVGGQNSTADGETRNSTDDDVVLMSQTADQVKNGASGEKERVKQVWFSGVHSNVGGGYPKQGLAHISLCWIADAAKNEGLIIDDDMIMTITDNQIASKTNKLYATLSNPHDKIYDPRAGIWGIYSYEARDIQSLHQKFCGVDPDYLPRIDSSVLARIARRTQNYAPFNIPQEFEPFDSCDTNPCGFLGDSNAPKYIKEEWKSTSRQKLDSVLEFSKSWSLRLRVLRALIIFLALLFMFSLIFGFCRVEFELVCIESVNKSIFPFWLAGIVILVSTHVYTDHSAKRKLHQRSSDHWSICIHKVHRRLQDKSKTKNS